MTAVGRYGEAIALLKDAIAIRPAYYAAWCNLGNAFRKNRRVNDAVASYRKALDLDSADIKTLNNLCDVFMQIGQPGDAIRAAGKAMILAKSTGQEALAREIAENIGEMRSAGGGGERSDKVTK